LLRASPAWTALVEKSKSRVIPISLRSDKKHLSSMQVMIGFGSDKAANKQKASSERRGWQRHRMRPLIFQNSLLPELAPGAACLPAGSSEG
jgi:hypothetical protein